MLSEVYRPLWQHAACSLYCNELVNRLLWQEAACSLSRENACLKQALGHTLDGIYTGLPQILSLFTMSSRKRKPDSPVQPPAPKRHQPTLLAFCRPNAPEEPTVPAPPAPPPEQVPEVLVEPPPALSVKRISGVSWGSPQQVSAVAKITLLCDELSSPQKYLAKLSIKSPVADLWLVYKCALVAVLEL